MKTSAQTTLEADESDQENMKFDGEIPKERYISLEKKQNC